MQARVLIIKHGAFGDIILATGAIKAIRQHHPESHITLLTTKPFVGLLRKCPWINEIVQDNRSYTLSAIIKLLRLFWSQHFDVVYDLQTSDRSSFYWWLMPFPKPKWSGTARFGSHCHNTAHRTKSHTLDRLQEQLMIAGIVSNPSPHGEGISPDISWMQADISRFFRSRLAGETQSVSDTVGEQSLRQPPIDSLHSPASPQGGGILSPYALLVPGGSAHRPEKRWPAERYAELVQVLLRQGISSVLIGSEGELEVMAKIEKIGPCVNLCGQTSFEEIAELARGARLAVGNDTGPTHVIAAAGCPTVALFATQASNPDLCAPKGEHVRIVKAEDLFYLPVQDVVHALKTAAIP